MKAFTFVRPTTLEEASKAGTEAKSSVFKAGGIDLLDRMKERIDEPDRVVSLGDLHAPEMRTITLSSDGLNVGALVTLAEIAASPEVARACPALAEAAGSAASPQIRARATLGGNLLQHTRCGYYRHRSFPCFKRGDDACPVLDDGAVQETAAIFHNRPCASAHPSSLAPVLGACGAAVGMHNIRMDGTPGAAITGRFTMFGLYREDIARGEPRDVRFPHSTVLTVVQLPATGAVRSAYEEIRQKSAFDWALVSCCARIDDGADGKGSVGLWLGSVSPIPWRAEEAERALLGKPLTDETIAAAADAAVVGATPLPGNAYKVDLVKVVVRRALTRLRDMK